jgi:hypothetical protein
MRVCMYTVQCTLYSPVRLDKIPLSGRRDYGMFYSGPGFLVVVRLGSSPTTFPPPPHPVSKLSSCVTPAEWMGRGVGEEPNHTPRESLALYKSLN